MDHLVKAGAKDRQQALRELEAGQKRGHWIWWAFPTLAVRGGDMYSGPRRGEDLASVTEAREYARQPKLRSALITQFQTSRGRWPSTASRRRDQKLEETNQKLDKILESIAGAQTPPPSVQASLP